MKLYTAEVTLANGKAWLLNCGGTHSTKGAFFLTRKGAESASSQYTSFGSNVRILEAELNWTDAT